ncbi:two-component regulator propeller domain-containing protein [Caldithrix abyssi]
MIQIIWGFKLATAAGLTGNFYFEQITTVNGLSSNTITAISQDKQGFLWIGTSDGLNRYDGYTFRLFKKISSDTTSLSSNFVTALLPDSSYYLWVGTLGGGLNRFDLRTEKVKRFRSNFNDTCALSNNFISDLCFDPTGNLWLATRNGLNVKKQNSNRFDHFFVRHGLCSNKITTLKFDREWNLWIGTERGLNVLWRESLERFLSTGHRISFSASCSESGDSHGLAHNFIAAIYEDLKGNLWIGTRGGGFSFLAAGQKRNGRFVNFRHVPGNENSLALNRVSAIYQHQDGKIWLGLDGEGLDIFDPATQTFTHIKARPNQSGALSHNNINHIFNDKTGLVWLTTWGGGLNKFSPMANQFSTLRNDPLQPNSLSNNFVFAIHEDDSGHLWIGTLGGGLNRWEMKTNRWTRYSVQTHGLSDKNIWTICSGPDGELWVGTEQGGLNRLQANAAGEIKSVQIFKQAEHPNSPAENGVRALLVDSTGLWVGYESGGLDFFDAKQNRWHHFKHSEWQPTSLSSNHVRAIFKDRDGDLWIGTSGGGLNRTKPSWPLTTLKFLHYRRNAQKPFSLSSDTVLCITQDRSGRLWIGTYGGGLNLLDKAAGRFTAFTKAQGLCDNIVYGILEDDRGYLWLSTNNGLSRFNYEKKRFLNFYSSDGLQGDEFNTGAYCRLKNGLLAFGGVNGLSIFDPLTIVRQTAPPAVVFTEFKKFGQPAQLDTAITVCSTVHLHHTDKIVSFEFAALDFTQPERNSYAYKIEGLSERWIPLNHKRFITLTDMPPGVYVLHVRAANPYGTWNKKATTLRLIVHPPFWQTGWFFILVFLALALFTVAFTRFRNFYRAYQKTRFIGHFKIIAKLGQGGMGTVYKAYDKNRQQTVALKILHPDLEYSSECLRRFLQEAEIGCKLEHPNIIRILEAGNQEKVRYIAMEFVQGLTLKQFIQLKAPIPWPTQKDIAEQILRGLQVVHRHNIVHRDLKSENIMVKKDGNVKIMDFGLARSLAFSTIARPQNQLIGTLSYMSPEQTIGKNVDQRSDIYSFGIILYELLFGTLPFRADNTMELIFAIHNERPHIPEQGLSEEQRPILRILKKCLEKSALNRYQTVDAILKELRAIRC